MSSKTTSVAVQYRLQEWAAQIQDCRNRPAGMSLADWCASNGISKGNYYYRLRRVRAACLESFPEGASASQIVPVEPGLLQQAGEESSLSVPGLAISLGEFSIHVTTATPLELLSTVLGILKNVE